MDTGRDGLQLPMKLASAAEIVPEYLCTNKTSRMRFAKCKNRHSAGGDKPFSSSTQPAGPLLMPAGMVSVRSGATIAAASSAGRYMTTIPICDGTPVPLGANLLYGAVLSTLLSPYHMVIVSTNCSAVIAQPCSRCQR